MNIVVISSLTRIAMANYIVAALRRAQHALLVISDVAGPSVDIESVPDKQIFH